ncbi:sigma-70 family RNA polymerase sigma factor [Rubellicoccus peritrichatus]|uniref:Sigma-70 family RNA polymerase sigma factor n=1 Tax=Rubellicoccus peritrichatus TaxID=3080537 RepID=A0AAQ3LI05_9BACT|nr:sigma-70 family RNA polymerase sigma factor [Puniceicoccus sp. CR14]WOO42439.1 sigma-70 family RNA polymerase sigma factor [Puniceicoccus sp. CR14]
MKPTNKRLTERFMSDENIQPSLDGHLLQQAAEAYSTTLFRYALSLAHREDLARDAVQETFLRLAKADQAKVSHHLAPWLFRVCRTRALDLLRKEARMSPADDATLARAADVAPSPASRAEVSDSAAQALRMVETLPENQREIVRLKFQGGLSYKEIAEVTELSVTNVGFLLHTAIKSLRAAMVE